jgi:hypothetical protein
VVAISISKKSHGIPMESKFDYWSLGMLLAWLLSMGHMDLLAQIKEVTLMNPKSVQCDPARPLDLHKLGPVRVLLEGVLLPAGFRAGNAVAVNLVLQLLQPDTGLRPSIQEVKQGIEKMGAPYHVQV